MNNLLKRCLSALLCIAVLFSLTATSFAEGEILTDEADVVPAAADTPAELIEDVADSGNTEEDTLLPQEEVIVNFVETPVVEDTSSDEVVTVGEDVFPVTEDNTLSDGSTEAVGETPVIPEITSDTEELVASDSSVADESFNVYGNTETVSETGEENEADGLVADDAIVEDSEEEELEGLDADEALNVQESCGPNANCILKSNGQLIINGTGAVTSAPWLATLDSTDLRLVVKNVYIGNGITSLPASAFEGCENMVSINFTEVETLTSIDSFAFKGCKSLTSITLPSTVSYIGQCAFSGCSALTSINIPSVITSIPAGLFEDCTSLSSITIPSVVTTIGVNAFKNCFQGADPNVNSIVFKGNAPAIHATSFTNCCAKVTYPGGNGSWKPSIIYSDIANKVFNGYGGKLVWVVNTSAPSQDGWVLSEGYWYYYNEGTLLLNSWIMNGAGKEAYFVNEQGIMLADCWYEDTGTGNWYYFTSSGAKAIGWLTLGSDKYYFNSNGIMQKGWLEIEGSYYFFEENGKYNPSKTPTDEQLIDLNKTGWQKVNGNWYYVKGHAVVKGWFETGGHYFYLDPKYNGKMAIGWLSLDGEAYYLENRSTVPPGSTTGAMQTGWQTIDSVLYYFESDGRLNEYKKWTKGWDSKDGKWYYLDDNRNPILGWQKINGKWYYLDPTTSPKGAMQTGWKSILGKWYYFGSSGVMQTGWVNSNNKWYYCDANGIMQTGWLALGDSLYNLGSSGAMQIGWFKVGSLWYFSDSKGLVQTGWTKSNNDWYYLDPSSSPKGAMQTGWKTLYDSDGKSTTYFLADSGAMQKGWQAIGGKWYYFNSSGILQKGWLKLTNNMGNVKWYYLDPSGGDMKVGWQTISGKWYYFDGSGVMQTGWKTILGKQYYFNSSGVMQTGKISISTGYYGSSSMYFFDSNGVMKTGWILDGSVYYYADSSGKLATGWKTISGSTYYFGSDGIMHTEWSKINNHWYYFGTNGKMVFNTTMTINGKQYTFDKNGVCTNM